MKSQIITPSAVLNIEILNSGKNFIAGHNVKANKNTSVPQKTWKILWVVPIFAVKTFRAKGIDTGNSPKSAMIIFIQPNDIISLPLWVSLAFPFFSIDSSFKDFYVIVDSKIVSPV